MKNRIAIGILAIFALSAVLAAPHAAFGHGSEIEVGGGAVRGPVKLDDAQKAAIGLKTVEVGPHPLATMLNLNGEIQLLPDHQADIGTIISGQIGKFYASLGDTVKAGQPLVLLINRVPASKDITINAPIDGVIDARNVIIGQAIDPNTQLFHISNRTKMIAVGKVFEEDLSKVKAGQEAHVRLLGYPDQLFIGKVTLVEPNLDPASRTVKTWVELDNPQDVFKPNMFARIGVVLKQNDEALAIPNGAIIEANGEKFVFVKNGESFTRTEISVGAADDEFTEVTDGLVPGDEVATQGSREIYTMWLTGGKMTSEDGD